MECLHKHRGAVIDKLGGRGVLIYIDPTSAMPSALYTDAAQCTWLNDLLYLDTGEIVRGGGLCDNHGLAQRTDRPMQLFLRWNGFAYTFPDCEAYEG